mgnify:CR=1 FL=1
MYRQSCVNNLCRVPGAEVRVERKRFGRRWLGAMRSHREYLVVDLPLALNDAFLVEKPCSNQANPKACGHG